jgi:hypothetical protein
MSLALFGAYRLLNPLQNTLRGFLPSQALQSAPSIAKPVLPLRVARVMEAQQSRQNAGRMVISGRMVDVCAELDRLADLEKKH